MADFVTQVYWRGSVYWLGPLFGREGPSIQLGSTIGQGVAQGFKASKTDSRVLLATGVASGLSAAFLGLIGRLYQWGLLNFSHVYQKLPVLPRWLHGVIPAVLLVPIMYFFPGYVGGGTT